MMPCCLRLTISTSRTCGSISPLRKPRSMMPMPPSSATAIAISDRVMVSMFAETIGRLSGTPVEKRHVRSMADGSRRSTTLYCGVNRKSSNGAPRTRSISVIDGFTNLQTDRGSPECQRRQRIHDGGAQQRHGKSPVHGDKDGERGADDRERAIDAPAPRNDIGPTARYQSHAARHRHAEQKADGGNQHHCEHDPGGPRPRQARID